jgi:hypothetical protein
MVRWGTMDHKGARLGIRLGKVWPGLVALVRRTTLASALRPAAWKPEHPVNPKPGDRA